MKWIIAFTGTSGDGYVSEDNTPTTNVDNCTKYDTEADVLAAIEYLQPGWFSTLYPMAIN